MQAPVPEQQPAPEQQAAPMPEEPAPEQQPAPMEEPAPEQAPEEEEPAPEEEEEEDNWTPATTDEDEPLMPARGPVQAALLASFEQVRDRRDGGLSVEQLNAALEQRDVAISLQRHELEERARVTMQRSEERRVGKECRL